MLTLSSPAKVNLFLKVVRRRRDGYHELASLFQAVALCDEITFVLASRDRLTCTDPSIPTDGSNLIVKAAELFRRKTGCSFGLEAHLTKRIPHQAGLGGGSSNAATTLWALNELHGRPATTPQLQSWAAEVGSDVAFFLSEGTAYCTGRGEMIEPISPLAPHSITIVKPPYGLSTKQVYRTLQIDQLQDHDPQQALRIWQEGDFCFFNDLEHVAFTIRPELKILRDQCQQQLKSSVILCGSGSALFGMGELRDFKFQNTQIFSTCFLNRSGNEWYSPLQQCF